MKLKLVVASMSILGLISGSVYATTEDATNTSTTTKTTTTQTQTKKHVRLNRHERMERREATERQDDKETLPVQPEMCSITPTALVMEATTQNLGRAIPNPCNPGWFNRIHFAGGATVDFGKFGNRNADFQGENTQRFSLNDVYLNLTADVNEWTSVFASIEFSDATSDGGTASGVYGYSAVYSHNNLNLEQAILTFGNFNASPIYIQVGKMFQDFSRYEIHPITRSMTQVMSEALETSGKLGFILPMGLNGSVSVFDNAIPLVGKSNTATNYGAALGYDQPGDVFGWSVGAAYMYNLIGAQDVAHGVTNFTLTNGYHSHVDGYALYGDVNSGPFALSARWTAAAQRFNPLDLPSLGFADTVIGPFGFPVVIATATGAKPWTGGIQAGYGFEAFDCHTNNLYLGYQGSHEAAGLGLPSSRWQLGYNVDLFGKNTLLGIEWDYDHDYGTASGGNGNNSNLVTLRAGAQFS